MSEIPRWQKITALVTALLTLAVIVIWHSRLGADFWPPDASRVAPNLLASVIQWALILMVAALIWPPTRKALHRFVDQKMESVHTHLQDAKKETEEIHKKLTSVLESHDLLHTKIDAMSFHHPDIPDIKSDTSNAHTESQQSTSD